MSNLIAQQPNWIENVVRQSNVPPRSQREVLYRINDAVIATFALTLVLILLARGARTFTRAAAAFASAILKAGKFACRAASVFSKRAVSRAYRTPRSAAAGGAVRLAGCA